MDLRVTTWNVNSIRRRLDGLARLVDDVAPDVLCLQETKATDAVFPIEAVQELGFPHYVLHGQKSYNGVAILSRLPLTETRTRHWCGLEDCRHVSAMVDWQGGPLEVHSLYVPAGGDIPNPDRNAKFAHKLQFLKELAEWSSIARESGRPILMAGDFNVAPLECDVWDHDRLKSVVTHTPVEVDLLEKVLAAGRWIDAVRRFIPAPEHIYTWWSYRAPDWEAADKGRRLDHIWVSEDLAGRLMSAEILRHARSWTPPSDHAPVTVTLRAA